MDIESKEIEETKDSHKLVMSLLLFYYFLLNGNDTDNIFNVIKLELVIR